MKINTLEDLKRIREENKYKIQLRHQPKSPNDKDQQNDVQKTNTQQ